MNKISEISSKRQERSSYLIEGKDLPEHISNDEWWEMIDNIEADDPECTRYCIIEDKLLSFLAKNPIPEELIKI